MIIKRHPTLPRGILLAAVALVLSLPAFGQRKDVSGLVLDET